MVGSRFKQVEIDLDNVLWRTRGRHYDYTFVLRPKLPASDRWYDVYKEIFREITPDGLPSAPDAVTRHGRVNGKDRYVATAFLDADVRDQAGRPIGHSIVWFPLMGDYVPWPRLPGDWGRQIVSALEGARHKTEPPTSAESSTSAIEAALAEAVRRTKSVLLTGEPTLLANERNVVVLGGWKKKLSA